MTKQTNILIQEAADELLEDMCIEGHVTEKHAEEIEALIISSMKDVIDQYLTNLAQEVANRPLGDRDAWKVILEARSELCFSLPKIHEKETKKQAVLQKKTGRGFQPLYSQKG